MTTVVEANNQTEHDFVKPGTLSPPGPIGRLVRLGLGVICIDLVIQIVDDVPGMIQRWWPINLVSICTVILGFYLLKPVIDIGISKKAKRWPQFFVGFISLAASLYDAVNQQPFFGAGLTASTMLWMTYVYGHLGVSFLLSAAIKTPGCEMRAIPHLWSKLTGSSTLEHYCPGPLSPIDTWERKLFHK